MENRLDSNNNKKDNGVEYKITSLSISYSNSNMVPCKGTINVALNYELPKLFKKLKKSTKKDAPGVITEHFIRLEKEKLITMNN